MPYQDSGHMFNSFRRNFSEPTIMDYSPTNDFMVNISRDEYYTDNITFDCSSSDCQEQLQMLVVPNPNDFKYPWISNSHFYPNILTYVATLLLGVTGNLAVIVVMRADHKARTNTNMFLCSLSIADLIMLMVCVPIEIFRMFAVILDFGSPSCTIGSYILMISFSASVLNLTAVSLERFIVIVFPMRSRSVCTTKNCGLAVLIVWLLSVGMAFPTLSVVEEENIVYSNLAGTVRVTAHYCKYNHTIAYIVFKVLALFCIPAILMICCYAAVIRELWKSTKTISALTNPTKTASYGSYNAESYVTNAPNRRRPISSLGRPINPSSPALGVNTYGDCGVVPPPASLNDPFSEKEDIEEMRQCQENEEKQGTINSSSIKKFESNDALLSGSSGLTKMYTEDDKLRTTSAIGLTMYSEYESAADKLSKNPYTMRANTISCTRNNVNQENIINTNENDGGTPKEEFQLSENNGINQRQNMPIIRNLMGSSNFQTSLRNSHPLNYNNSVFAEERSCSRGTLFNGNRKSLATRGRKRSTSLVSVGHCREERKKPPITPRRDDVKKTRKQVIKMLVVVVVLFILCWGPTLIVEICIALEIQRFNQAFLVFKYFTSLLPFIHCCINPIIYCFMSRNFRKSMWRAAFRHSPCCSDIARSHAGLPPHNGCCKCVRYGDGCCGGGGGNSSNSGGLGCSKMCCDKQSSTSGGGGGCVQASAFGVVEPSATITRPMTSGVETVNTDISTVNNAARLNVKDSSNVTGNANLSKNNTNKYNCSNTCFYVCCCAKSLPNLSGIDNRDPIPMISRAAPTRYSSTYHEAPTAELHIDLGNISNI